MPSVSVIGTDESERYLIKYEDHILSITDLENDEETEIFPKTANEIKRMINNDAYINVERPRNMSITDFNLFESYKAALYHDSPYCDMGHAAIIELLDNIVYRLVKGKPVPNTISFMDDDLYDQLPQTGSEMGAFDFDRQTKIIESLLDDE